MSAPRAATIDQILRTSNGDLITVDADVLDITKQLSEIDPCLRVRWSGSAGHFVVYGEDAHGDTYLVTTAQELDGRVLERVRQIRHPDYDLGAELDRIDDERDRELDHNFREQVGEAGERLHHVLKNKKRRIFLPDHLKRKAGL